MGPITGNDTVNKRQISCLYRESNQHSSAVLSIARRLPELPRPLHDSFKPAEDFCEMFKKLILFYCVVRWGMPFNA
jgi:hypothetical protein